MSSSLHRDGFKMHVRRVRCQGKITSGSTSLFKLRWILFMLQRPIKGHSKYNNWVCECAACVYMRDVTLYISLSFKNRLKWEAEWTSWHAAWPSEETQLFLIPVCVCVPPLLAPTLLGCFLKRTLGRRLFYSPHKIYTHTPKALCKTASYTFFACTLSYGLSTSR